MHRLLFLAVLAERHNAVELLVVLAAGLAAELVDLILRRHTFRFITSKLTNLRMKRMKSYGSSALKRLDL